MTANTQAISIEEELNGEWFDDPAARQRPAILHLVDPGSPGGGACTLHLIADVIRHLTSADHDVMIVGSAKHVDLAWRCGVPVSAWMAPPTGLAFSGQRALQRYIDVARGRGVDFNLVHAWSARAAILARGAGPGGKIRMSEPRFGCIATLHVSPMKRSALDILQKFVSRPVPGSYPSALLASAGSIAKDCKRLGWTANSMALFPPAVDPGASDLADRAQVRARWAREHQVDERTFVVGLLSEPISWPDAQAAATSVARANLSGRRVKLVLHHRAKRRVEADRFLHHLNLADLIILDDQLAEPWQVVAGLDAALIPGARPHRPAPSVLPTLWAMAAGVPAIVESCDASGQLIDDEISGLLIDRHDVNAASLQIVRLFDDREFGKRLGQAAQARVSEINDISSYVVRLRHTYDLLLAARPIAAKA